MHQKIQYFTILACSLLTSKVAMATTEMLSPNLPSVPESSLIMAQNNELTAVEQGVINEINHIRRNPRSYIRQLQDIKPYFEGNVLNLPNQPPLQTQEGVKAVNEAINFLRQLAPAPPVSLSVIPDDLDLDLTYDRIVSYGRVNEENSSQTEPNPVRRIILQLLINDGITARTQRQNLFNPNLNLSEILCGATNNHQHLCTLTYRETSGETNNNSVPESSSNPESTPTPVTNTPNPNSSEQVAVTPSNPNVCFTEPNKNDPEASTRVYKSSFCIRGTLNEEDDILVSDESFYDDYFFQTEENESFTITLESDDFDSFLAIQDPTITDVEAQIIGQNDDMNENTRNSKLEITLEREGIYRIIVNSYDPNDQGEYKLTVTLNN